MTKVYGTGVYDFHRHRVAKYPVAADGQQLPEKPAESRSKSESEVVGSFLGVRITRRGYTGPSLDIESVKKATLTLARAMNNWKGSPVIIRVASALGVIIFAIWRLGPLVQKCRNTFLRECALAI